MSASAMPCLRALSQTSTCKSEVYTGGGTARGRQAWGQCAAGATRYRTRFAFVERTTPKPPALLRPVGAIRYLGNFPISRIVLAIGQCGRGTPHAALKPR